MVAYAMGAFSWQPFIIKFFPKRASFDAELALRDDPALTGLLPQIHAVHDPYKPEVENLAIIDRWGRPLPPCIVMPRGESLSEWRRRATPDIFQTASVRPSPHLVLRAELCPLPMEWIPDVLYNGRRSREMLFLFK